jgi:hypothetical protein
VYTFKSQFISVTKKGDDQGHDYKGGGVYTFKSHFISVTEKKGGDQWRDYKG